MHRVVVICCIIAIFALAGAEEEVAQALAKEEIEETNQDSGESKPNFGSEVALMDSGSSEDAPDSLIGEDGAVIRAKRYCGYGGYGCCGCNCNCATMAPGVTFGPCGCCGCGFG